MQKVDRFTQTLTMIGVLRPAVNQALENKKK
jgi:hypothetical protein